MSRTLITVGTQTAVTLPPEWLERYGLKAGDMVDLVLGAEGILIAPSSRDLAFEQAVQTVFEQRHDLFQRLADFDRADLTQGVGH
jgi:bifunctional DNA-binding transcriptional regulator/antitoxin component of YhaV-PrlF toxin-antitoxin module